VSQPLWQKSSYSGTDPNRDCVELTAASDGIVLLRESDAPGAVVATASGGLRFLLAGVKAGEFDGLGGARPVT